MQKLFIPTKIKVGYQERSDTYTKRLAYVIYYDQLGKLRKEASWKSWCDSKIPSDEFDNKPHSGFVLNKGVQRYGHWGSGRNMVRVYDDRGIEFEITVSNLMFILMATNCHKRGLEGEFVYAWAGAELILLPTGCEEYEESKNFTQLQAKKIGVKDLIVGASYKTKKLDDIIYMGRFDWYDETQVGRYYNRVTTRKKKPNQHVFYGTHGYKDNTFFTLSGLNSLAAINSDIPVSNYADLMDKMSKLDETRPIEKFIVNKVSHVFDLAEKDKWLEKKLFLKEEDGTYTRCRLSLHWNGQSKADGYTMTYHDKFTLGDDFLKQEPSEKERTNYGYYYNQKVLTLEEVNAFEFYTITVKLDNAKEWSLSDVY